MFLSIGVPIALVEVFDIINWCVVTVAGACMLLPMV